MSVQGDNNRGDDRVLYAAGQDWLHHPDKHIMGRVVGCVQIHVTCASTSGVHLQLFAVKRPGV